MADIKKKYAAKAFVSCSLRTEDENFVNYVCRILDSHNIQPFGTVGKFAASPENPVALMNKNIPLSDIVVICATKRYLQKDLKTGAVSYGLSEMVHFETGMAVAHGKPVVVFVQEGTDVGSVLPNITQYITLNGQHEDFEAKRKLIFSLLNNAYQFVRKANNNKTLRTVGNIAVGGLAIYGGIKLFQTILGNKKKH
ncbi:MAG: hypothetical protein CVU11_16040 [Bacteroidetes bacterium HGW-Bacteroidetes-6]|jgi:hypothetical protein|nr:MAG: hypothetical protein CVU11_16040 [Bacteroidetes bacterium HGW-Bacteroidetes-6]